MVFNGCIQGNRQTDIKVAFFSSYSKKCPKMFPKTQFSKVTIRIFFKR